MKGLLKKLAVFGIVLCLSTAAFGLSLQVTPANLYFTAYESGENPAPKTITIKNLSDATVDWQIVDANEITLSLPPWLFLDSISGSLDPNGMPGSPLDVLVSIDTTGLAAGNYSYVFDVLAAGAERLTVSIELDLIGPIIFAGNLLSV